MSRVNNKEIELSSALMQSDRRVNQLLTDNKKLKEWIERNEAELKELRGKILLMEREVFVAKYHADQL